MTKQKLLLLLVMYLASAGITYAVTTTVLKPTTGATRTQQSALDGDVSEEELDPDALLAISPNEPKNQPCPLNGKLYTQTERDAWEQRRPLAVMVENSPDARPQSGLAAADIVFEALAEGGVTRFMAMYYCGAQAKDISIAPVRSARTYFIDWASGFNFPLYVHVGGANVDGPTDALQQIIDYGWNLENDLNQFSIGYPTFVRNESRIPGKVVATEHTMVSSTEKLWAVGEKREWTNINPDGEDWKDDFKPLEFMDGKATSSPTANNISFEFWDGFAKYGVNWVYDSSTNSYKRNMAGEAHIDLNTNEQITAKNAIVLFSDEKGPINAEKHMLYKTTGTGDALIFQNGEVITAKWSKPTRVSELRFVDAKGSAVPLVRGLTWISVVAPKTTITY